MSIAPYPNKVSLITRVASKRLGMRERTSGLETQLTVKFGDIELDESLIPSDPVVYSLPADLNDTMVEGIFVKRLKNTTGVEGNQIAGIVVASQDFISIDINYTRPFVIIKNGIITVRSDTDLAIEIGDKVKYNPTTKAYEKWDSVVDANAKIPSLGTCVSSPDVDGFFGLDFKPSN